MDYYKILNVHEKATIEEIKKSYRQLALKYHPDKNPNNSTAESNFKILVEAYEILSDENLRASYDFKLKQKQEQRTKTSSYTYQKSEPKKPQPEPQKPKPKNTTLVTLENFSKMRIQCTSLGVGNVDIDTLFSNLNTLLSDNNIKTIIEADEILIVRRIIDEALICCNYLDFDKFQKIVPKIVKLAGTDNDTLKKIYTYSKSRKKEGVFEEFYGIIIFGVMLFAVVLGIIMNNHSSTQSTSDTPQVNSYSNNYSNLKDNGITGNTNIIDSNILVSNNQTITESKYKGNQLKNGASPLNGCFGQGIYNGNAKLTIKNGSNADAIICLYSMDKDKTIRNKYVRANSNLTMSQIGQGEYKIRVFYGNDWNPELINDCGKKGNFESDVSFSEFDGTTFFQDYESGHSSVTITLYTMVGGNISSSSIDSKTYFNK